MMERTEVELELELEHTRFVPAKIKAEAGIIFAAPEMKGRRHPNGTIWGARSLFIYNVAQVLYKHNNWHARTGKQISFARKGARWTECMAMAHDLHNLNFRILIPTQFKAKHVVALTRYWESKRLLPQSILQKVCILRTLLGWVNKEHVIANLKDEQLYANPEVMKRDLVAKNDKGWEKKDKEILPDNWTEKDTPLDRINRVVNDDAHVARQLKLSHYFGLRAKETMMFRPGIDYDVENGIIRVGRGTKGGRPRVVPVVTNEQKAFLRECIKALDGAKDSMMPTEVKLLPWIKHYYKVCNRNGISRAAGFTPHGLRHGYAHRLFEAKTGQKPSAVTGEKVDMDLTIKRIARLLVSEDLGHSRDSIASAYLGK